MQTNLWQLCPKCNGEGTVYFLGVNTECNVCNGQKLISTLTGFPRGKQEHKIQVKSNTEIQKQEE